jgi:site-specific recombinase XerD
MRRYGPDGKALPDHAYVFDNDCGERLASVKTAWHNVPPRTDSQPALSRPAARIGSRLMELGADPHDVRDFLGHANITTTARYLRRTPLRLDDSATQASATNTDPKALIQ